MPFKQEHSDKLNKLVLSQETSLDCFHKVLILKGTQRNKSLDPEKIFRKMLQLYLTN